jgi:hypothetical protein
MESGVLKGILWHQGESNTDVGAWKKADYEDRMTKLIAAFRADLKAADVPFVAGELGAWHLKKTSGQELREVVKSLEGKVPHFGFVSSEDLVNKKDDAPHFDTPSLRKFGQRYAEVYFKLLERDKTPEATPPADASKN